eukprot:TRINITY_DN12532_c0_g1_i2.p1 TRINITY_DN12532_c0_g1~~TRINITY_DN12532_c0_g1_i2.p1  ORF type:complete len:494 (-),score=137.14 TRINITY_DN12532_c0_g1_i2:130-1563(-)
MAGSMKHSMAALVSLAACGFMLQGCGDTGKPPSPPPAPAPTPPAPAPPAPPPAAREHSKTVDVPGWPDLKGKFPLSWAVTAGKNVYVSGMQGMDMSTMKLVEGGIKEETAQTLMNLQKVLTAANSTLQDITQCSVSLVNISRDFQAMNDAYKEFFPSTPPFLAPPARIAVEVAALAGGASVEIQCNAGVVGGGRKAVAVPGFPDVAAKGFPLSFATKLDGMVYMSGTQGMDMTTGKMAEGGVGAETTQALENLKKVLEAADSSPGRVVGCSVSLTNISDFAEMNKAYEAFWPADGDLGGLPTRVCVEVAALAGSGKVEIQCTAAGSDVPGGEAPKVIKVPGRPDKKGIPFSAAAREDGILYVSGNQGIDMKTFKLVEGGAGPETTQTLQNIKEVVEAAGTSLAEVVACEVSLKDMKDFAEMNEAYAKFWPSDPPSRVAVQVAGLAGKGAVEIRCAAALPPAATSEVVHHYLLPKGVT